MIYRFQYTAHLKSGFDITDITDKAKNEVADAVRKGVCGTMALFRYDDTLYLYVESAEDSLNADSVAPSLNQCLEGGWQSMKNVYYTSVPSDEKYWQREGIKERRGRIGRLVPDKLDSYVKYHVAIMEEGLFEGDKYLFIGLMGNTLFLYSESPEIPTHIRSDVNEKSKVIEEWRSLNPRGHFDHDFSGEANFVNLVQLFSVGKEDIFGE